MWKSYSHCYYKKQCLLKLIFDLHLLYIDDYNLIIVITSLIIIIINYLA